MSIKFVILGKHQNWKNLWSGPFSQSSHIYTGVDTFLQGTVIKPAGKLTYNMSRAPSCFIAQPICYQYQRPQKGVMQTRWLDSELWITSCPAVTLTACNTVFLREVGGSCCLPQLATNMCSNSIRYSSQELNWNLQVPQQRWSCLIQILLCADSKRIHLWSGSRP